MLKHLYIKNYTLIEELDIDFRTGFSVITGETGAGKSIVLGAIGLLLGQRADLKAIKTGADRCIVEASFDLSRYDLSDFFTENEIDEDLKDTIVRREVTASGKSRAFINDTPVSLAQMKELGEQLIDVHSQHQNLLLSKQDFQLEVVDIIAKDEKELNAYSDTYDKYIDTKVRLNNLQSNVAQSEKEADFMKFQYEELSEAKLVKDEQEELEEMSERMTHSEDIKQALYESESCFSRDENSILNDLKRSVSALRSVERVYGDVRELADRIESCYIELKDVDSEISQQLETIDFDPAELERINLRLDTIYSLQKKYHVSTVEELLAIQNDLKQKLEQIENSDEAIAELQRELETLSAECEQRADILTKKRQQAAKLIEKILLEKLVPLGMPHVRFNIEIEKEPLNRRGQDKISFLFSANTSTPLQPVSQVASGGEIARVMLAIKAMISGFVKLPTIIFDEIDTGVSGKIAEQMAQIMHEMGMQERQVISITHLPQIASRGMNHYRVYKEETAQGTLSHMVELSKDERVNEIAQMLSGSSVSEAAIENARQLLNM